MTYTFARESYGDIQNKFEKAIKWIEQYECSIKPTRISRYQKTIISLSEAYKKGTTIELLEQGKFPEIVNSLYEIREIIDIWAGLKTVEDDQLKIRLKEFLKGPENITQELAGSSSNRPRDIGFELYIGARFSLSGFDINFSKDGDISALYREKPVYIECKRPRQLKKIRRNINKAFNQLNSRYKISNNDAVGIIAFSINKLINPEQKLLTANNIDELTDYLRKSIDQFIRDYKKEWQRKNEKQTIGMLISLQTPCIIRDQNLITIGRQIGLNNITIIGTQNHELFTNIASALKKGTKFL